MKTRRVVLGILLLPVLALGAVGSARREGPVPGQETMRIGVATFSHETCTFCPNPTGVEEWEYYGPPMRGEEVLRSGPYIEGFVDRCNEYGGVELVGVYSPRDAKGGSSGSWITAEAFDKYSYGMADDLRDAGRLDGLYLSLHGAMAVTGIPRPEAELVRRLREAVGDIPIVVTLDLHANEDHELSEAADAVLIIKRYPHYDSALQGERAARMMIRIVRGTYRPAMATRKPGVITPSVYQGTGVSPAMEIMERARRWECRVKDAFVSVAFGFAYADVPDAGATVMVITNGDQELADTIADDMSGYIWRVREEFAGKKLPKTEEGVSLAIAEIASSAAVGDSITVSLGGYADRFAGNPVPIDGRVEYLGPYDRFETVAVLLFGDNNRVILTPLLHQVTETGIFDPLGIPLEELDIIVLKSRVHFRRGYYENGLAGAIFEVDAPGLGPADLTTIGYKNVPKDLYPIYRRD